MFRFFSIHDKCRILTFREKKVAHFNVLGQKVTYLNEIEGKRKEKEERERGKRKRKEKEV